MIFLGGLNMSCGCTSSLKDGKDIVDHVTIKGKANFAPTVAHEISCECGETFTLKTVIMNCPKCEMTYAVTPCGSDDSRNIKLAGIKYA
jgi:Zn finger protein HypA/HybF involved in hydrogenase expression